MNFRSLLPLQASPLRRTVEEASQQTFEIDFPIKEIDDFEKVSEAFLPFAAWGVSTSHWDRDWPIEKKRAVAKAWLSLHRKQGTIAGIEEAIRFFDAKLLAVRHPPDAFFPEGAPTKAEREAYLARFRQLRFYNFRSAGLAHHGAFTSSGYKLPALFPKWFFPHYTDAPVRIGRRAFIFDPKTGIEEPVHSVERVRATRYDEARLPGKGGHAFFAGHTPKGGAYFPVNLKASERIYSVEVDRGFLETESSLRITGILPSADPIQVRPRRVAQAGIRRRGQLYGGRPGRKYGYLVGVYLPTGTAGLRLFDQIYLHDPDRLPDKRGSRTFAGYVRLGMPPYHAQLTVELAGKRSRFAFDQFVGGHLVTASKKKLRQTVEATRQSKALRDKVLLQSKTVRTVQVSDGVEVDTIEVGAKVRDI